MLDNILDILKNGKDKIFYKIGNDSISYMESYNKVLELSDNLRKQGDSPVIVYGHKDIDMIIGILSCVVAQRCYIPIDINTPMDRINSIIKESNSKLFIKTKDIDINDIEALDIDEFNNKYHNIDKYYDINNNYAYIIFTSGSTGNPKGVPISYENLNNFIDWIINCKEFDSNNYNLLSQASFSFDLSVMDIYFSLFKRYSIIALDNSDISNLDNIYNIIKNDNINFIVATPTFVKILLLDDSFNSDNYNNLNYMFFCGELLEVDVVKKIKNRFNNIKIINAYGPTEATCCVSLVEIDDDMINLEYLPVGRIAGSAVDILIDNDEIILKGKSVFSNYLNIDSDNCFKDEDVNCYRTGDIGYIDNDYLYCKGRIDSQIKYKGYRIDLLDIENNLLKIDGVREAVVVCKYKDNSRIVKIIKGYVTLDKDIDLEYIKKELGKLVPNYMIPKKIEILDNMPINRNLKYDRKKLELL